MHRKKAPIERKVALGGSAGVVTGMVVWLLTTLVPVFHNGLPPEVMLFVGTIVPAMVGAITGYFAQHSERGETPQVTTTYTLKEKGSDPNP